MKPGSLVEYIGGQDRIAESICPLYKDRIYVVELVGVATFKEGVRPSVGLEEHPGYSFVPYILREIQPPTEVNIEELCKSVDREVTQQVSMA